VLGGAEDQKSGAGFFRCSGLFKKHDGMVSFLWISGMKALRSSGGNGAKALEAQ
jgi:hypothetical protein